MSETNPATFDARTADLVVRSIELELSLIRFNGCGYAFLDRTISECERLGAEFIQAAAKLEQIKKDVGKTLKQIGEERRAESK